MYLTCSKKLTGSQLSLSHGTRSGPKRRKKTYLAPGFHSDLLGGSDGASIVPSNIVDLLYYFVPLLQEKQEQGSEGRTRNGRGLVNVFAP